MFCEVLRKADVSLRCISEYRWRGEGKVALLSSVILFSGVPLHARVAEQGVGIVLDSSMEKTWTDADQLCEFRNSRLMRIKLLIVLSM